MDRRYSRTLTSPTPSTIPRSTTPQNPTSPLDMAAEPKSEYLRRALHDRKQKRSGRLSVPHIDRSQLRASSPDSFDLQAMKLEDDILDDEWTREAGLEAAPTPQKLQYRRASMAVAARQRGNPTQEMESTMAKLEKQNFDLKIRVCMQEERAKKLETDLQEALDRMKDLAESNEALQRQREEQDQKIQDLESEAADLVSDNKEMFELYDLLFADIDRRDTAIDEAADMVCVVEEKKQLLEAELKEKILLLEEEVERWKTVAGNANKSVDSDYFSAGVEISDMKHSISFLSDSRPSSARQSDYFSAESTSIRTPTISSQKDSGSLRGRIRSLKQPVEPHRIQRVGELRAKASYTLLPNDSFTSYGAEDRDGLAQRIDIPIAEPTRTPTGISAMANWSGERRGSAPSRALRNMYLEGEQVGGLAQLRTPLILSPSAKSHTTTRSTSSAPRSASIQRSNSSCGFRSPGFERPNSYVRRGSRRSRPDLARLTTTIPVSGSAVGAGIIERTTAWLGTIPRIGGETPRDMIFNRNAEEFGASGNVPLSALNRRDTSSRNLWP